MGDLAKLCRYCRKELKGGGTVDHVVPKWVMRLGYWRKFAGGHPNLWHQRNRVSACHPCNRRKGSMPAAIFVRVRLEGAAVIKPTRSYWDHIAATMALVSKSAALEHPLAEGIITAFSEPIPLHFPTARVTIGATVVSGADYVRGG